MEATEVHKIISTKYDKLLWTIAHKISGDIATSSVQDNYQDLWLAVFEAVEGFTKQNDYGNGPIEDWIGTKSFDKYLKTCLWNKKNHKGKNITNRYHIHRDTISTHLEEVLNIAGSSYNMRPSTPRSRSYNQQAASSSDNRSELWSPFGEMSVDLSPTERLLVTTITSDPERYLSDEGKLKVSPIQRKLGWDRNATEWCIYNIKKKMNSFVPKV